MIDVVYVVNMDKIIAVTTFVGWEGHTFYRPSPASLERLRSLLRSDPARYRRLEIEVDEMWGREVLKVEKRRRVLGLSNTNKVSSC